MAAMVTAKEGAIATMRPIPSAICFTKTGPVCNSVSTENLPKKSRTNSQKSHQEQRPESCPLGISELEKVSEVLGLRSSFLNEVLSLPDDILYHRGLKGLVRIFIEREYYDIEEEPLKEKLSKELLKQLGFTDSEVLNTIVTRAGDMKQHLDPIDFIKRFINDEFMYNPALKAMFRSTEDQAQAIPDDAEEQTIPDGVEVLHFSDYRNAEQNEHCEVVRLFHGTDLCSAVDIMKNGIELDFGRHKHDFSDGGGFYLTTFEHAKKWASSQTRKPVVLELKIQKKCLQKARVLNLDVDREEWERVVSENRSGRPSKKLRQEMKECDCIEGPVSESSQDTASTPFKPEPGSYQLCVIKRNFAREIVNNAKFALYFSSVVVLQ